MKKNYIKPEITFDNYELTVNIAAGCAYLTSNQAPYECAIFDEELGFTIFSDSRCQTTPPGGNDSICYNIPVADTSVYTS